MKKNNRKRITVGGNLSRPGQTGARTIVLTQPQRFGIDIGTYMNAIRAAENVDYSRRVKLYDLYSEILMDAHLSSVINKRKGAVLSSPIEFQRDGVPDDAVNAQLRSPWFYHFLSDALDAIYWGGTLCQFFWQGQWMDYELVPRKHVDPVKRLIMRHQTDVQGESWDQYDDLLYIGESESLGLLAAAAPYVIYKRNTMADWAQFSEVFGMPIREYTYNADDEDARSKITDDAYDTGSLGIYVHPEGTTLKFVESGNKTGSADLYKSLSEFCNAELSKLVLGNTLTTEAGVKGSQALGTVHKSVEERMETTDRHFLLNILNFDMADIFQHMGIDTQGGEFAFVAPQEMSTKERVEMLASLKNTFNLPIDDDYLYKLTGVEKPKNYKELKEKAAMAMQPAATKEGSVGEEDAEDDADGGSPRKPGGKKPNRKPDPEPTPGQKRGFKNWLQRFFDYAPEEANPGAPLAF